MSSITPEAAAATIDMPAISRAGRELLSLALMDARNHTLHLLAQFEEALAGGKFDVPVRDELLPPLWLAGHIGWFAEFWIGRNPQRGLGSACPVDALRLGSIEPRADRWFNPALAPREARWRQPMAAAPVRAWLLETLESTLELLEKTPESDESLYFFRAALFHEDACGEQFITMAQTLGVPLKLALPGGAQVRSALLIPAGRWILGAAPGGFVVDVEKWAHEVFVPEFEIDAQPVTWAQYVEFVDDGGYDRPEFWSPEGWTWLQRESGKEGRRGPRHVDQIGAVSGAVTQTLFGMPTRMSGNQHAMHVSWWEADAWTRWAGRRLPAEVEWEMAAHAAARRGFRWGDVREWTAGSLRPWPGFVPDSWSLHTGQEAAPLFDKARVQRGASFATRARMKTPKRRAFALPSRDDGFTGFRSCAL